MPKQSILTIFILLFTLIAKSQSTCNEIENKISIAKDNIDKGDDGLMCPNAVQFYTNLHIYQCEPLTHEEGIKLKKELEVMKRIYNEYEMWCEDIGEIKDPIPDIPAITLDLETNNENSESSNQENLDNNSLSTNLNSILGGTSDDKSGDCSYAALNKFGSDAWSTKAGEDAAVQYEGYRCHCLNGTLPDGFTDPSFDPKPNDLNKALVQIKGLRDRHLKLKSSSDPQPSPLPTKCLSSKNRTNNLPSKSVVESPYQHMVADKPIWKALDPQSHSYYKYGGGIKAQVEQITNGIANQLKNYSQLAETNDPEALLIEFNSKMDNIDLIEEELNKQARSFFDQQGNQLVDQINSKDAWGALYNIAGSARAFSDMREQEKQIAEQRAELQRQKQAQMNEIRRKQFLYTKKTIERLRQQAAFTESEEMEQYYLNSIDYVWCSFWKNDCTKPEKPTGNRIENNLISKELKYKQIVKRKLDLYEKYLDNPFTILNESYYIDEGMDYFLDAAAAFAAVLTNEKPTAQNYIFLAEVQSHKSNMIALTSIMMAKEIDKDYVLSKQRKLYYDLVDFATRDIEKAIIKCDKKYIESFLAIGLDRTLKFKSKNLLTHAIDIDQPDAVQIILNHYMDGLNQSQITEKTQKVIMLAADLNSPNTLNRLMNLGIDINFTISGNAPVDAAAQSASLEAYELLLSKSNKKQEIESKYQNSKIQVLINASSNPQLAASLLDAIVKESDVYELTYKMVKEIHKKPHYLNVLGLSSKARKNIQMYTDLNYMIRNDFAKELMKPSPESKAVKYVELGLIHVEPSFSFGKYFSNLDSNSIYSSKSNFDIKKASSFLVNYYENQVEEDIRLEIDKEYIEKSKQELRKWKTYERANINLTNDERRLLDAEVFEKCKHLTIENKKALYNYLKSNYETNINLTKENKLKFIVDLINSNTITDRHGWKYYFENPHKRSELKHINENLINSIYTRYAIKKGERLDLLYLERKLLGFEYSVSLIYLAFQNNNYELFKWFDKHYDLSILKINGVDLKKKIFAENSIIVRSEYYSKDYLTDKEIQKLIWNQIDFMLKLNHYESTLFMSNDSRLNYLFKDKFGGKKSDITNAIIDNHNWNVNTKYSQSGGNLLHHLVDLVSRDPELLYSNLFIFELGCDSQLKDNYGKTAVEYLKEHKREFFKFKENDSYSFSGKQVFKNFETELKKIESRE